MGKWFLHRFYDRDRRFHDHLPPTALYSITQLKRFFTHYEAVYIKPDTQHMGKGIIKAWRTGQGYQFIKVRGQASPIYNSIDSLYKAIGVNPTQQRHVIQKAIPLTQINGRPYDIRVMMMRNHKGSWKYAGMLAKVAGVHSVISNVRRGNGYVLHVEKALQLSGHFSASAINSLTKKLKSLSYAVCERSNDCKFTRQIGIDFGIDRGGAIWLIEVNFDFPSHALFAKLKDKTMYFNIKKIAATWNKG